MSHTRDGITQDHEKGLKAYRENGNAQQVHLESNGQMSALFQDIKAGLRLDGQI